MIADFRNFICFQKIVYHCIIFCSDITKLFKLCKVDNQGNSQTQYRGLVSTWTWQMRVIIAGLSVVCGLLQRPRLPQLRDDLVDAFFDGEGGGVEF